MKEYKLIKKYPGSPEIGFIFEEYKGYLGDYNNYPEYWELIVKKEYEILSFIQYGSIYYVNGDRVIHKTCPNAIGIPLKYCNYPIHSVQRLSDGEIFTIGDIIQHGESITNKGKISKISLVIGKIDPYILISYNGIYKDNNHTFQNSLKVLIKSKQPLFKTEDGVDLYDGDTFYVAHTGKYQLNPKEGWSVSNTKHTLDSKSNKNIAEKNGCIWFSIKEKAEEYILINKPCLSINDLNSIKIGQLYMLYKLRVNDLKELVKSKL